MRNAQITVLSAADTASQTGSAIDVGQVVIASFQLIFGDATAAGTLKIQMSNDLPVGPRNQFIPTNWSDIALASSTVASGVGAPILIANLCASYLRAVYTRSGGGSTTIVVNMNTLGA